MKRWHFLYSPLLIWSLIILSSIAWNFYIVHETKFKLALHQAQGFFREIILARAWNASFGGVYVPVSDKVQPNPYLQIIDRDVQTTNGLLLTKINPSYMTRQMAELSEKKHDISYHITSLHPLRPGNEPDSWEKKALLKFQQGKKEVLDQIDNNGRQVFRYMAPLGVDESCLGCHDSQRYQIGAFHGGISVTIPAADFEMLTAEQVVNITIAHLFIWLMGLSAIILFYKYALTQMLRLNRVSLSLSQSHSKLEIKESEHKNTLKNLRLARQEARQARKAITNFLANMSHEIRTPLNSIIGFSDLMLAKADDQEKIRYLRSIKSNGESLQFMVNDIIDLSQLEAGKMVIRRESVDITAIMEEMANIFSLPCQEKGLKLRICYPKNFPLVATLDELRLRQILINLISNSIKFTPRGGIRVSLFLQRIENKQIDFSISIADSGIGLAAEDLKLIFQPFAMGQNIDSREFPGTGMGLSIAKRLTELMGGTIACLSKENKGTLFRIRFTHVAIHDRYDKRRRQIHENRHLQYIYPGSTVLIADDIQVNRTLIKKILNDSQVTTHEAKNGSEAISIALQRKPDLILMDIRMPKIDGIQASRIIKNNIPSSSIPIIAFTAEYESEQSIALKYPNIFSGFLHKPIYASDIHAVLTEHLEYTIENREQKLCVLPHHSPKADFAEPIFKEIAAAGEKSVNTLNSEFERVFKRHIKLMANARESGGINQFFALGEDLKRCCQQPGFPTLNDFAESILQAVKQLDLQYCLHAVDLLHEIRQALAQKKD